MRTYTILGITTLAMSVAVGLAMSLAEEIGAAPQDRSVGATPAPTYKIDSVHSTALFRVHHLNAGQFWGRFNKIDGSFTFADGSAEGLAFDVSIQIESIDTNNDQLNGHLKSPDFFNAREFKTMTFKSVSARATGGKMYEVTGDLTMHGVKKRIKMPLEWTGSAEGRMGARCGFEAIFTIKRSEYEVMYGVANGMVGNEIRIIVGLEGVRQ